MNVTPWVSHDRLDDEVMVINLKTGAYFAFQGAAADTWTLLVDGHDPSSVAEQIARRYAVEAATAAADIDRFVDALQVEELLQSGGSNGGAGPSVLSAPEVPLPYEAPSIEKYDDLQDLLLLDPIHDVEEAGWPAGRVED
ncbi:MAG TPA: PqqD family protein [Acidimicrobiales bacterium]|nr:PqqD family protein [Acidimicrobiales bacterium]